MEFIDRKREIKKLHEIDRLSCDVSQFTVISGRRRIGKTLLVQEAYKDTPFLYFFVARKTEQELCRSFVESLQANISFPIVGKVSKFAEIFTLVMEIAKTQHLILMIDEFQEFYHVNPAIYSEMQDIWDRNHKEAHINLIVCGSVNSLLNKIFRDKKEPLYGRQTDQMRIRPFQPSVLKEIMERYNPQYKKEDLLALYLFTGGVAKYVELFVDKNKLTQSKMLDFVLERDSFFLTEGYAVLIEEFGKEYGTYFTIMSLIAQGHNMRSEIEDMLQMEISGYLKKLIDDYELVQKHQPLFETAPNKNVHYSLRDPFLRFWFRFIFKYNYILEAGGHEKLKELVKRDYSTYSGLILEDYFRQVFIESGNYTRIGYWHDRKGNNEIDLIAADELSQTVDICEVKRQEKAIDLSILRAKADVFLNTTKCYKTFHINYRGLSMDDMV